ncbi:MAG TPA: DUF5666 domain-containing protein [Verrucomicrobiota bacterium]|nr:DUF5666 domain-containing protein [Verrucomicrobiota bacterium]
MMKKNILRLTVLALLAALVVVVPARSFGEDKPADSTESAKPKRDTFPFRGKVGAVDKEAKTFTVGERTFQVTADTKIMKAGKAATLDDAVVGEEVGGAAKKTEDGKLIATSVRFGPKPTGESE